MKRCGQIITGYTFYRVEPTVDNSNIKIKALNPLNVFVDRNIESPYVKNSYRIVIRHWMTKSQILNKYGKERVVPIITFSTLKLFTKLIASPI